MPNLKIYRDCSMSIGHLFDLVQNNTTKRFDCPICNTKGALSITKANGSVKYNCFESSCTIRGSRIIKMGYQELLDAESYAKSLLANSSLEGHTEAKEEFRLPDYLIMGIGSKSAFQMLLNNNSMETYQHGMFKTAFDPKQNRLVFLIHEEGKIVGAVGKALENNIVPKVINYPNSKNVPFTCGTGSTVVLVEDCLSACSIGRIKGYVGLALLGTNLKSEYLAHIVANYENVIVALDPDAYVKSITLMKSIEYYTQNVKIWKLEHELKHMDKEMVNKFIGGMDNS